MLTRAQPLGEVPGPPNASARPGERLQGYHPDVDAGPLAAAIVALGLIGATWVATRALVLKRQTDSLETFLDLVAIVHGEPRDGRHEVGSVERLAAIWLIAELGKQHRLLRASAREALTDFSRYDSTTPTHAAIATVAQQALNTVPE